MADLFVLPLPAIVILSEPDRVSAAETFPIIPIAIAEMLGVVRVKAAMITRVLTPPIQSVIVTISLLTTVIPIVVPIVVPTLPNLAKPFAITATEPFFVIAIGVSEKSEAVRIEAATRARVLTPFIQPGKIAVTFLSTIITVIPAVVAIAISQVLRRNHRTAARAGNQ